MVASRIGKCPVCGSPLEVREYGCLSCGTVIRGHFRPTEFDALSEEQLAFLRVFLRARGNLSTVARELGVSHPTARAKLDALLAALGYEEPPPAPPVSDEIQEILNRLERGELTAEEAERLLRGTR